MTGNEYQALAARTSNLAETTTYRATIAALGIAGEGGEVVDLIKKWVGHKHPLNSGDLTKELGDLLWYIAEMCSTIGLELNDVMEMNIRKLKKRYPDGFSSERSINRERE